MADSPIQELLIDFFVIGDDLTNNGMDVCVKRGAKLSTYHHLVVCKLWLASLSRMQRIDRKRWNRIRWQALVNKAVRRNSAKKLTKDSLVYHQTKPTLKLNERCVVQQYLEPREKYVELSVLDHPSVIREPPGGMMESVLCLSRRKLLTGAWRGRQTAETRQTCLQARDRTKEVVVNGRTFDVD